MSGVIGILGGMGPAATVDLYLKILKATPAETDQDHLRVIIDVNPKVPDRTRAILVGDVDPVPLMLETARNLERAGADFLLIPCNTAHYFYERIQQGISIPVVHMIREAAKTATEQFPTLSKVGLLATTGTVTTGLYQKAFSAYGVTVITPDPWMQEHLVMEAVYGKEGIKAGISDQRPVGKLRDAARSLVDEGAQLIVAGCTEVSLVRQKVEIAVPWLDPPEVLARVAVERALESYQRRQE